jgi:hypothetical protein
MVFGLGLVVVYSLESLGFIRFRGSEFRVQGLGFMV